MSFVHVSVSFLYTTFYTPICSGYLGGDTHMNETRTVTLQCSYYLQYACSSVCM